MKQKVIVIKEFSKISEFVNQASMVDGDVAVKSGRWVVDGKSLMGVYSLSVDHGVTIEYPDDATAFEKYLNEAF